MKPYSNASQSASLRSDPHNASLFECHADDVMTVPITYWPKDFLPA